MCRNESVGASGKHPPWAIGGRLAWVDDTDMACSFCGKSKSQVRLIAGPEGDAICAECVNLFNDILNDPGPPQIVFRTES
jgi:hypothetical protein